MKVTSLHTFLTGGACALATAVALSAAPTAALADVTWIVHATFDDGTKLSGKFSVNVYSEVSTPPYGPPYSLLTQTDATDGFAGDTYTGAPPPTVSAEGPGAGEETVEFFPNGGAPYDDGLLLTFTSPLNVASQNNDIVFGWECQDSFNCPTSPADSTTNLGGPTRYITEGFASAAVPEPATWAMMLVGVGLVGGGLRLRRKSPIAALPA